MMRTETLRLFSATMLVQSRSTNRLTAFNLISCESHCSPAGKI